MIKRRGKAVICLTLALSFIAPSSYADERPQITIVNQTGLALVPLDMKVFNDYLDNVKYDWGAIYPGPYVVFIVNEIPYRLLNIMPHNAVALHTDYPQIFVSMNELQTNTYNIYTAITHELAEVAVDPFLNKFDSYGRLIEICDPYTSVPSVLDHQTVATYALPGFYNLQPAYTWKNWSKLRSLQ